MIEIRLIPALLFCSGTLSLYLAWYTLDKRRSTLTHIFALFAGSVAIYAYGYAFELLSQNLEEMLFWSKVQYLGISYVPGLMLAIAVCYTGRREYFSRRQTLLIFAIPLIVMVARLTNPWHHLFYRSATRTASDAGALLLIEPGPFYLLHAFFSNLAFVLSLFLLIRFYRHTAIPYKRQTLVILAGCGIQWMGYMVYLTGFGPPGLDLNPLMLAVTVPMYALGILRFSMFSLVPVAREKVFEEMRDGVVVVDPDFRLVDFNRRSAQLFAEIRTTSIGISLKILFRPYPDLLNLFKRDRVPLAGEVELTLKGQSRRNYFQVALKPLFENSGREIGSIITFTDITTQRNFMEKLARMATVDELTGIYNRRHLLELGEIEIQRFKRSGLPLAILMLDVDRFKKINDTWGHQSGDRVLKAFAVRVRGNIRATDIFGRFGGEEFMIIMPDTPEAVAVDTAERLCRLVQNLSVSMDDTDIRFTVSIGVAGTWNGCGPDLNAIAHKADKALYEAKQNGRNQVVKSLS